jgi:hypothetical protein
MIHLKKFNESSEEDKREILDNFDYISDKFGEPVVVSSKYGESIKWFISWDIKLNLSVLQEANQLISKLKDIVEDIDDVLSASDRLDKFNINMSLTDKLKIELVPKDTGGNTFKFIKGYNGRSIYVIINEIERFFNSKGIRVVKWDNESSFNENNKTNELEIFLNKNIRSLSDEGNNAVDEFYNLIMVELNSIKENGGKEYMVNIHVNSIVIYPMDEKAFVEVN